MTAAPTWDMSLSVHPDLSYAAAYLSPDYILGRWFCVQRDSGKVLWAQHSILNQRGFDRFVGVADGIVVVANLGLVDRGLGVGWCGGDRICGVRLEDGEILWTVPNSRFAEILGRFGYSRWLPSMALRVEKDGVHCRDGEVICIRTGKYLARKTSRNFPTDTPGWQLINFGNQIYKTVAEDDKGRLELDRDGVTFRLTYFARSIEA